MKLVIDANMAIAALIRDSKARQLILSGSFELSSPNFILQEIYKYEKDICKKAGLAKDDFELLIALVFERVTIIPRQDYEAQMHMAGKIMKQDIKDVPYVACYLALKCNAIWTSDPDFDGKKGIKIVTTAALLEMQGG